MKGTPIPLGILLPQWGKTPTGNPSWSNPSSCFQVITQGERSLAELPLGYLIRIGSPGFTPSSRECYTTTYISIWSLAKSRLEMTLLIGLQPPWNLHAPVSFCTVSHPLWATLNCPRVFSVSQDCTREFASTPSLHDMAVIPDTVCAFWSSEWSTSH